MSLNNRQKDIAGLLAEWRELADGVSHDMATEFDTDGDFNITLYADPDDETSEQAVANLKFLRLAPVAMPALLTAVENVLKKCDAHDGISFEDSEFHRGYSAALNAIRDDLHDALGGAE